MMPIQHIGALLIHAKQIELFKDTVAPENGRDEMLCSVYSGRRYKRQNTVRHPARQ